MQSKNYVIVVNRNLTLFKNYTKQSQERVKKKKTKLADANKLPMFGENWTSQIQNTSAFLNKKKIITKYKKTTKILHD